MEHIQVAAKQIQNLLICPKKTIITLQSYFLCDENSIIISQQTKLLNFQLT